ncbi:MAG TPA: hypothetical protein VF499_06825 [Afipia sp.]
MAVVARIVYAVWCLGVAGCTLHFMYLLLWQTEALDEWNRRRAATRWDGFLKGLYFFAAWCGIYAACWGGVESALSWMPRSWVHIDDDGERQYMATAIGGTVGLVVSLFGMIKALELARHFRDMSEAKELR